MEGELTKTVLRMAQAMRRIKSEREACTEADLIREGFTRADIARHGDDAAAIAARAETRNIAA